MSAPGRQALCALAAVALCATAATGDTDRQDEARARLWGALVYTRLSMTFEQTPAREAIETVGSQLGVPILGRFRDDPIGYGIDPNTPITFDMKGATALNLLEEILEQCGIDGDCTWQIRRGFIEVGTRPRLSVPAARERRLYPIRDFLIDVPNFASPMFPGIVSGPGQPNAPPDKRRQPEFFALEVVEDIVENIEPGNWDYGQIDYDQEDEPPGAGPRVVTERSASSPVDNASALPKRRRTALPEPQYVQPRKIATIRYWRDVMIIDAPDYIHRQIDGYPEPIPPDGLDVDADQDREDPVALMRKHDLQVAFLETPAQEVFEHLALRTGVPLVVRYQLDRSRDGIDPSRPITIQETTGDTLTILEQVLDRCGDPERCTWQVRRGYVEVGPKTRLSVPEARVLRLYDVQHLLVNTNPAIRKKKDELAEELIGEVVSVIEPGHWEVGRNETVDHPDPAAATAQGARSAPARFPQALPGPVFATISHRDGALVVRAPPFMHRRLDDYLRPPR